MRYAHNKSAPSTPLEVKTVTAANEVDFADVVRAQAIANQKELEKKFAPPSKDYFVPCA